MKSKFDSSKITLFFTGTIAFLILTCYIDAWSADVYLLKSQILSGEKKMNCPYCNNNIADGYVNCPACGAQLVQVQQHSFGGEENVNACFEALREEVKKLGYRDLCVMANTSPTESSYKAGINASYTKT